MIAMRNARLQPFLRLQKKELRKRIVAGPRNRTVVDRRDGASSRTRCPEMLDRGPTVHSDLRGLLSSPRTSRTPTNLDPQ